ncbi:hypothetical protein HHO41_04785 [Bacillus sp. DNRA2]|uniref:hypothetical protein n=1 Tax=Bacillus sp. DNRA2 TaxID=2723053 RepID=UPI00145FC064|nr:hypothetical protein [Bacillus sp. DNRA2]NMD69596.1 hypothetical protein [Bacillus sp. DNRA2]
MDHVIGAIQTYYEIELDDVADELRSGKYGKLSDCPSYRSAKAMLEAIRVLERAYYGEGRTVNIREEMRYRGFAV